MSLSSTNFVTETASNKKTLQVVFYLK